MCPERNESAGAVAGSARLAAIRGEIDAVDGELLRLFNQRAALSREVGRIKAEAPGIIFKPLRERDLLDSLAARNPGALPEPHLRAIWREILSSSRALQRPQNVAYLGPEGTFSYFAGVEYLGHAACFHPCRDIAGVFEEVCSGACELGVVPLENSLQGTVGVSFDLFLKHDVVIEAELFSRISHCLLSTAESLARIRTVYSHPQPLAQCGGWLRAHLPAAALVPVESTAAAAERAVAEADTAAIGNGKLADLLGLGVLARRIEDEPGNWTRFVIIAPRTADARAGVVPRPTPGDQARTRPRSCSRSRTGRGRSPPCWSCWRPTASTCASSNRGHSTASSANTSFLPMWRATWIIPGMRTCSGALVTPARASAFSVPIPPGHSLTA